MFSTRFRADGSIAFITGGNRGIGLATARALGEAGARLVLSGRDEHQLHIASEQLASEGFHVTTAQLDVTDPDRTREVADRINKDVGPVDILVANAGIAWPDTPAEDISDRDWRHMMDVNLDGTFWSCRAFGQHMLAAGRGAIVVVGSMSGLISNRPQRQVAYNASKAALHQMTRSMAGEWAERKVRVNAVAPGYVNTDMSNQTIKDPYYGDRWMDETPMKRMIEPEEIASTNLFLATEASSGMTGSIVVVDAGYTIW